MTVVTDHAGRGERQRVIYLLIAVCFLLSGFAALLYETVWLRQFAIILGTSEQALAVILASYMGGLAAGSWVASKKVDRVTRPVWLYGLLEGGIAVCAIAMPWGLALVGWLQVQLFGNAIEPPAAGSFSQVTFGLISSFALILLPTAMMGATLPLLAKQVVHHNRQVGPRVGILYGINTFGAVAGTLAAAFWFLPSLGLKRTTWVGAAINLGIFVLVWLVARKGSLVASVGQGPASGGQGPASGGQGPEDILTAQEGEPSAYSGRYGLVLWFAAAAGAVAFCYEIIFTRMLSHVLGGSIYAFATMLAGFLLGIALGGSIASRLATTRSRSVIALAYSQGLAGLFALFAYHLIDRVAGWSFTEWGGTSATSTQVAVSVLILLPTAVFIGATFPLATRIFARDQSEAATGSARVYFWNTVGGITGALMTGIYLLPALGYEGATGFAIGVNACLALGLVWVMGAGKVHSLAGVLTIICLIGFTPVVPERLMRASALDSKPTEGTLIFSEVGRSGTVVLFDQQGDIRFLTNGLPEAIVTQYGTRSNPSSVSGAWLSALPPLLRPECDSMMIIGLGGGVAAAYVPPSVSQIDVFELEPSVVDANRFIRDRRDIDPLADDRVKIILNDGRNGLALTSKKYDAIVSQPSHPWTAGASHLYTREFAETVAGRLNRGGIFLQWMSTDFANPDLFRSLAATLLDVFPHVRLYEPFPRSTLFVASDQPIRPEAVSQPVLQMDASNRSYYAALGIRTPTQLFGLLRIDEPEMRELSRGYPLITDEYNLLAMRAPRLLRNPDRDVMKAFLLQHASHRQSAAKIREDCPTVNAIDLGLRMANLNLDLDPGMVRELVREPSEALLFNAVIARKDGQLDRWAQLLREAASLREDDPRPAFLLLAHSMLGTYKSLDASEAEDLATHLDDRYGRLLQAVESVRRNDLAAVRDSEQTLASFADDEIGYELAVRLQLMWRITDEGPDRKQYGREALELSSNAMAALGQNALIAFQVMAAIKAEQPELALARTVDYAKSVVEQITQQQVTEVARLENLRSNLIKCHSMISDAYFFRSVPSLRYRAGLDYVEKVIAGNI